MHINAFKGNNVIVISPVGNIDSKSSEQFNATLPSLLKQKEQNIILNMKDVSFMDSSGLISVVGMLNLIHEAQKEIKISNPSPMVLKLLHLRRLEKTFDIYDTQEEAINSF